VLAALGDAGRHLGHGLGILSNVVNPDLVVLGGYFVPLAPWLTPGAEGALRDRTAAPDVGGCRIAVSTLGHGAAATSGAVSILDTIDSGHLPVARTRG
jgi:predicted NBD/HSP70 family sugar kinase